MFLFNSIYHFMVCEMPTSKPLQLPPPSYAGAVETNLPLMLLMPEMGLSYILNSSDPLCLERKKDKNTVIQNSEICVFFFALISGELFTFSRPQVQH